MVYWLVGVDGVGGTIVVIYVDLSVVYVAGGSYCLFRYASLGRQVFRKLVWRTHIARRRNMY